MFYAFFSTPCVHNTSAKIFHNQSLKRTKLTKHGIHGGGGGGGGQGGGTGQITGGHGIGSGHGGGAQTTHGEQIPQGLASVATKIRTDSMIKQ